MPFVKFNSPVAGHRFAYSPGDVVDWPDADEVAEMTARGIVEEISPEAAKEATKGRMLRKHVTPKEDPKDQQRYNSPETATRPTAPERTTTR